MILVREGSAEQRHDSVAEHLVDGTPEAMHRFHHEVEDRINEPSRIFGIEIDQ